jgi:hypothetical protein
MSCSGKGEAISRVVGGGGDVGMSCASGIASDATVSTAEEWESVHAL